VSKYGDSKKNSFCMPCIGLPDNVVKDLESAASHSLAKRTWDSYKTAERLLATYCKDQGLGCYLPVDEQTLLGFVHWLAYVKKVTAGTINSYLAGIRKLHIVKGMPEPQLRTQFVQMVLAGRKNIEAAQKLRSISNERQPVTPDILALIKSRLREWQAHSNDKITVWTVSTLLFHGALRGGEILSRSTTEFDPAFTLLKKDLHLSNNSDKQCTIQVNIKAPKEDKDCRSVIVDIYQTNSNICPVSAFKKWQIISKTCDSQQPAFRLADGTPLTTRRFNCILKERLDGFLDQKISAHSFRSGAASMMATLGYSDKDVKAIGRWSSRAFEAYIKLPRSKRIVVAKKVKKHGFK
jgi:hypothetical protein